MVANKNVSGVKRVLAAAVAVAAGGVFAAGAAAKTTTFAQFEQATPGDANQFTYTESGVAGGTATLSAFSAPVDFSYESLPGLPADLQGTQDATLTLTAVTDAPAVNLMTLGGAQPFVDSIDTLTITRDTPAAEGTGSRENLLSVTFTTGELAGQLQSSIVQFSSGLTGVTYSSDFLDLPASGLRQFGLTFSSWTTTADGNGLEIDPGSSLFADATAAGVGSFDTTLVPEPGTAALVGACVVPVLSRRRRRAAR